MSTTSLQLTFAEIQQQCGMMLSLSRNTGDWTSDQSSDVLRCIRNGLRKFYYPPPLGPGEVSHRWSFLCPQTSFTTSAPFTTGTIAISAGAVTLSGGTFPTWATSGWLEVNSHYYEVTTRTDGTHLVLTDTSVTVSSGTAYSLKQYQYDLPSDFESLESSFYMHPDDSLEFCPLEQRPWASLRKLYEDSSREQFSGEPKFFSLLPKPHVATGAQGWKINIWPTASTTYVFEYRYNVTMNDLDGTSLYPPGGGPHSQTILEAVFSEAESLLGNNDGTHKGEFQKYLVASVSLDRQTSAPRTFGRAPIMEGGRRDTRYFPWNMDKVLPANFSAADIA